MFNSWVEFFFYELIKGNALRKADTLYYKIEVDGEFAKALLENGFDREEVSHPMTWKDVE